jgi:1-acyl-sn-glycerol-3-phosphate acyltransferase
MLATLRTLLLQIPLVTLYTAVCGCFSLLLAAVFRDGAAAHRVARVWARLILWTCQVRVEFDGLDRLDRCRNYVFASNHQSLFDTPILFAGLPFSFRILYKQSLHAIPFLGWHLFLSGHIPVDRRNAIRARRSLERAVARVRQGVSVVVFPEGTRSREGTMGRFKPGSFLLAIKAGVPVVPVTIVESWRIMSRGRVTVRPGLVRVSLDRPIPVDGLDESSIHRLCEQVREIVARNYSPPSPAVAVPSEVAPR